MAVWIAGITRGHNGATCLLKDGEVVFYLEEERLSKNKEILEKISIDKMRYLFNKPQYYIVFTRKIKD